MGHATMNRRATGRHSVKRDAQSQPLAWLLTFCVCVFMDAHLFLWPCLISSIISHYNNKNLLDYIIEDRQ